MIGESERFVTPWMLYNVHAADRAIGLAREGVAPMNELIRTRSEPS